MNESPPQASASDRGAHPDRSVASENNNQRLLRLVQEVAQEEGFGVEILASPYAGYYTSTDNSGHRCIDGRAVRMAFAGRAQASEAAYLGSQFPGGTLGLLDVLRASTGFTEAVARDIITSVCMKNNARMGGHIDNEHGHIQDTEILTQRNEGCGNQGKAASGGIELLKGLIDTDGINARYEWLRSQGAAIAVLAGEHQERLAAINLEQGITFDTSRAVTEENSIFNLDLPAAQEMAGYIYDEISARGIGTALEMNRQEFTELYVKNMVKDFLQTIKALTNLQTVHYHMCPEVVPPGQ